MLNVMPEYMYMLRKFHDMNHAIVMKSSRKRKLGVNALGMVRLSSVGAGDGAEVGAGGG